MTGFITSGHVLIGKEVVKLGISEIVRTIAGLYYGHQQGNLTYPVFVERARQALSHSSLDFDIDTIYEDLSGIGTQQFIQPYTDHGLPKQVAFENTQRVLQYSEFFIKYQMLMPRIEKPHVKSLFENIFAQSASIDAAIARYNELVQQQHANGVMAYLVSPPQPIESIVARSKRGIAEPVRQHHNKYGAGALAKAVPLI